MISMILKLLKLNLTKNTINYNKKSVCLYYLIDVSKNFELLKKELPWKALYSYKSLKDYRYYELEKMFGKNVLVVAKNFINNRYILHKKTHEFLY